MPTPLEQFLEDAMKSPKAVLLDRARMAIGTDKDGFSPLLEGIRWVSDVTNRAQDEETDWVRFPYCYAWERVLKKEHHSAYDAKANQLWTERTVTGSAQEQAPFICHVFHAAAASAIAVAAKLGALGEEAFMKAYKGRQNATYDEVCTVLKAGYTKVSDVQRKGHIILMRP